MKINKIEFPKGTAIEIRSKIKEDVSMRTIYAVLAGTTKDNYGILPLAIKHSKKVYRQQEKIKQELAALRQFKKSLTPKTKIK
jgi:hypothetical protein